MTHQSVSGISQPNREPCLSTDNDNELTKVTTLDQIERLATNKLSQKAWAYYYSASDDLHSKVLNNTAYGDIFLRPGLLANRISLDKHDFSTTILGHRLSSAIYVSPTARASLAHPDGEHGIAQVMSEFGALQIISNFASMNPEDIVANAPSNQVFGWQLYVQADRSKSEGMIRRINRLDSIKFVCLTLDSQVPGKREHDERSKVHRTDPPPSSRRSTKEKGILDGGIGIATALAVGMDLKLTWKETLPWLAKNTSKKIVLKGIQTHEDALLAARHPLVSGIIISNHGGRALDTAPPPILTLLEIRRHCPEVFDKLDVLVDGGIKHGSDVVKAIALGAKAVGVGRAVLWGLAVGGQNGVRKVMNILTDEALLATRYIGATSMFDITPSCVNTRILERQVYRPLEEFKANLSYGPYTKEKL